MENEKIEIPFWYRTYSESESPTLSEGQICYAYGYEFIAVGPITSAIAPDGKLTWYYTGKCTESKRNDDIRHTGYNGAHYSWRPGQS